MAIKEMNVDVRSSIAKSFYTFCKGYCTTQIVNPLTDGCEYCLILSCHDDDVNIRVTSENGLDRSDTFSMEYVMDDPNLIEIVESFSRCEIEIDIMTVHFTSDGLVSISLNIDEEAQKSIGEYVLNKETGKLELYFDKDSYLSLSDEYKASIKSNFLFSRAKGAWVSRAKLPNLWRAEKVVKSLGLKNSGTKGESISFRESMERKAERAERRAERYEAKAVKAEEKGTSLQKPINDMHGDIAFFTQPNINSSSGRAFTRRREKMFAAFDKGFEEFKKSEYYKERAEIARSTADFTKPTNKSFCIRRIDEAEKAIKAQKKNLDSYKSKLDRLAAGEILHRINGEVLTESDVYSWIDKAEEVITQNISKSVYYRECLEELGGVGFSRENVKLGYIVELARWGDCKVAGVGPKNISYIILEGGAKGFYGKAPYADIIRIVSDVISPDEKHSFKTGDVFNVKEWDRDKAEYVPKEYTVIGLTEKWVKLKSSSGDTIVRKPRRVMSSNSKTNHSWALDICKGRGGTVYKEE